MGAGFDLTLIEVMPLGAIEAERADQFLPLNLVEARLRERFTLREIDYQTGGPARYVQVAETGGRLGFITPLTHNFCEGCNRVRVTCTGTLYMCLGQERCGRSARAAARVAHPTSSCMRRSKPPSPASPRAMISSSIANTPSLRSRVT